MHKPFIIGLAGGSGSGKSTLAAGIEEQLPGQVHVMHADHYFIDPSTMPKYAGVANYDHPRSVDRRHLVSDIQALMRKGNNYPIIIVEGFMLLHFVEVRDLLDLSIFLGAPHEVTIARRVHDASEHYRTNVIKPMYEKYVKPSARYADYTFDVSNLSRQMLLEEVMKVIRGRLAANLC